MISSMPSRSIELMNSITRFVASLVLRYVHVHVSLCPTSRCRYTIRDIVGTPYEIFTGIGDSMMLMPELETLR